MKKFISIFLALCLALAALCVPAAAQEPTPSLPAEGTENDTSSPEEESTFSQQTVPLEEELTPLQKLTEDCNILQYVDEQAFEAANHAFRLPHLEKLDTYVFQNPDGTRSVYYLYENVKYIDEQGNVREKDNTLCRETAGYRIAENEFDLLLPHSITDGVELSYKGYDVKLTPASEGKVLSTSLMGTLRENSVVYDAYFGTGTSLVYTPLLSGVKEEIVLEEYLPNQSFAFLLQTDGLYLVQQDGQYVLTEGKDATGILQLGSIVVYDAVGRPSLGNMTVETIKDGNFYLLTVSADESFLSDSATVYPVTIDPDMTILQDGGGTGTGTSSNTVSIEDTTIYSGTPNLNTGDWVYTTAGYVDETYKTGRVLVRLPGLYNSTEFQGLTASEIVSATYFCTRTSVKDTQSIILFYNTADWTESTATWSNMGGQMDIVTNWGKAIGTESTAAFDITTLVQGWTSGTYDPEKGFVLLNQHEYDATKKYGIHSREHSNTEKRPYFVLTHEPVISFSHISTSIVIDHTCRKLPIVNVPNVTVLWSSSNTQIATVATNGTVTGLRLGEATIYAHVITNGTIYTASYKLYVRLANGTYYFNSARTSKYLNNNNGVINGYSAAFDEIEESAGWQLVYQTQNTYLIRSSMDPSYYLMEWTSPNGPVLRLMEMTDEVKNRCLWTITSGEMSETVCIKSCFGRELYSTDTTASNASVSVALPPPYSGEWRYKNALRMQPLITFGVNTNEVECYRTTRFQVQLDSTGYSFVHSDDFSYAIKSGSSYISLSGGFSATLTGKNAGTAQIEITYKVSNQKIVFPIQVRPYLFKVGISADTYKAYTNNQYHGTLKTDLYLRSFFDSLSLTMGANVKKGDLVQHINTVGFGDASKMDFETVSNPIGAIADQVDFMVYMGHGLAADRDSSELLEIDRQKGNYLHYNYTGNGVIHDNTGCYNDALNLYTSEARFSHPRWVWLYTCNFLHESEYVTVDDLISMMDGTHILMGYSTQAYLCLSSAEIFASYLANRPIIDSFFAYGDEAERYATSAENIQVVIFINEARYEALQTPPTTYQSNQYIVIQNNIQIDGDWES